MTNDEQPLLIQCECGGEILLCEEECETFNGEQLYQQSFAMSFFSYGNYVPKPNLWWRIKYAWRHLRTGKIHHDHILLDDKKAEILAKYIKQKIEVYRPSSI